MKQEAPPLLRSRFREVLTDSGMLNLTAQKLSLALDMLASVPAMLRACVSGKMLWPGFKRSGLVRMVGSTVKPGIDATKVLLTCTKASDNRVLKQLKSAAACGARALFSALRRCSPKNRAGVCARWCASKRVRPLAR